MNYFPGYYTEEYTDAARQESPPSTAAAASVPVSEGWIASASRAPVHVPFLGLEDDRMDIEDAGQEVGTAAGEFSPVNVDSPEVATEYDVDRFCRGNAMLGDALGSPESSAVIALQEAMDCVMQQAVGGQDDDGVPPDAQEDAEERVITDLVAVQVPPTPCVDPEVVVPPTPNVEVEAATVVVPPTLDVDVDVDTPTTGGVASAVTRKRKRPSAAEKADKRKEKHLLLPR